MAAIGNALDRALTALECVAAEPGVGPVLFVDLDPALLPVFAAVLGTMIGKLEPELGAAPVHVLGPWHDGEALWSRLTCRNDRIVAVPGPLAEEPGKPAPVLAIPRLDSVGLTVSQALLTQIGPEDLRTGARRTPRARWLAAADGADLATMSSHLLDRFAARIDGQPINAALLHNVVQASADQGSSAGSRSPSVTAVAQALIEKIVASRRPLGPIARRALWTPEAALAVLRALSSDAGRRRDLALAHSARALATRVGADTTGPDHVLAAARMLGLAESASTEHGDLARRESASASATPSDHGTPAAPEGAADQPADRRGGWETVKVPDLPVELDVLPIWAPPMSRTADSLFPEQGPESLPMLGSLREARRGTAYRTVLRGPVVGDKPLDSSAALHDLALAATLVRGSMRRAQQRQGARDGEALGAGAFSDLSIRPTELRQRRRSPRTRAGLVLVLDHSCLAGWAWPAALAPHLQWAYQASASVTLIECGHHATPNEFVAHRVRVRSLADPAVGRALSGLAPGRATPLAHALDLAAVELRRWTRAGEDVRVRLVVATDGRGNIPLAASSRGRSPSAPVHREGVEDGFRAAESIRPLIRPQHGCHLIGPATDHHPELLVELALRLGAELRRFRVGDRAATHRTSVMDRQASPDRSR